MVQVLSKLQPTNLYIQCCDIHNFDEICVEFMAFTLRAAVIASFKTYAGVYLLTLLMKFRIPTKQDIKRTLHGILQSTAFLSGTGFGYSFFLCLLRRVLGHFNILSVSGLPAFLASVFAILIERPSRRTLLALYVSNVATETLWNMAVARNMVRNIRYGDVAIFSVAMSVLLFYYKGGYHKDSDSNTDSMFGVLRFVVGPYEEKDHSARSSQANSFYRQQVQNVPNDGSSRGRSGSWRPRSTSSKNAIFHIVTQALRAYKKIIYRIKCCDRHLTCPHPFSCLYYTIGGTAKMFSIGIAIQVSLKLLLNARKILQSPLNLKTVLWKKDTMNLACFLGGFSGLFRAVLCLLRRTTGKDSPSYAIPAGIIGGMAYSRYPDTTVALYVLWKAAHVTYNMGVSKGMVPKVPGFTEFLYCFSTAVLFHAALLEPTNLRPSYWKFLHSISGGRIACMNRIPLDVWGLGSSQSLEQVLLLTRTQRVLK